MSNTSESQKMSTCANCGKGEESSINLKSCAACRLVKYCSRDCQAAHRPQHKKACKKRAKEIHDEMIFKEPQPLEDCPICMIRLPTLDTGRTYMNCCGKVICSGCVHAFRIRAALAGRLKEDDICPFCRNPTPTTTEAYIKQYEKRMELNDAQAISSLGCYYSKGEHGLPQSNTKALELWHRAGELGCPLAYSNIACMYMEGGLGDKKKVLHYCELSAIRGNPTGRLNLGTLEGNLGNYDRALKHYMIAVRMGEPIALETIQQLCKTGLVTKDDYAEALRSYQLYLDEIKSDLRDEAAAFMDDYKYC